MSMNPVCLQVSHLFLESHIQVCRKQNNKRMKKLEVSHASLELQCCETMEIRPKHLGAGFKE